MRGEYVNRAEDFLPALERSYRIAAAEGVSTVVNCQAIKEFWSSKDYPPGFMQKGGAWLHVLFPLMASLPECEVERLLRRYADRGVFFGRSTFPRHAAASSLADSSG